jgi:hypothetical protein
MATPMRRIGDCRNGFRQSISGAMRFQVTGVAVAIITAEWFQERNYQRLAGPSRSLFVPRCLRAWMSPRWMIPAQGPVQHPAEANSSGTTALASASVISCVFPKAHGVGVGCFSFHALLQRGRRKVTQKVGALWRPLPGGAPVFALHP